MTRHLYALPQQQQPRAKLRVLFEKVLTTTDRNDESKNESLSITYEDVFKVVIRNYQFLERFCTSGQRFALNRHRLGFSRRLEVKD
jgi:hypothetical protein